MQRSPRSRLGCILFIIGAGSLIRSIVRCHHHTMGAKLWRIVLIASLTFVAGTALRFMTDHTDRLGYVYRPAFPWAWIILVTACAYSFRTSRILSIVGFVVGAVAGVIYLLPPLAV